MGHHTLPNMKTVKQALGEDVYLYGEGWHFGEMPDLEIENARQELLYGSGIGSFNDRLRDLVRGGSPFDSGPALYSQSYVTGLSLFNNERNSSVDAREVSLKEKDLLRVSLVGNIKDVIFENSEGNIVNSKDLMFRNTKIAYSQKPSETINYVSKHDNQTLWDNTQYKLPIDFPKDKRIALHALQLSYPLFSFGVPFIHMGSEFARSKAFSRDSFNSGDFYNSVDFSLKAQLGTRLYL